MGQYYIVLFLGAKPADGAESLKLAAVPFAFGCGAKLLENGFAARNPFVEAIEYQLTQDGAFHRTRMVWAGDYADTEPCGQNLYHLADEAAASLRDPVPAGVSMLDFPFIVNHTKKQYVRKNWNRHDGPLCGKLHPLAILTCEGNGRGGGDYHGDYAHVGAWARDEISVEKEVFAGYSELPYNAGYG